MPIDLPIRKSLNPHISLHGIFDQWVALLAALCFIIALAGLVSHTPRTYREGLSAAVYEAMLQSP